MKKHAHCSYCGHRYVEGQPWPRTCGGCGEISYLNPLPVAVCLVPVDGGLLCIRRTIPPAIGELAMPGGFMDPGESWQEAVVRELREETGIHATPEETSLFAVHSSFTGPDLLVLFGLIKERPADIVHSFTPTNETSEAVIIREAQSLAFPLHTQVLHDYLRVRGGRA